MLLLLLVLVVRRTHRGGGEGGRRRGRRGRRRVLKVGGRRTGGREVLHQMLMLTWGKGVRLPSLEQRHRLQPGDTRIGVQKVTYVHVHIYTYH